MRLPSTYTRFHPALLPGIPKALSLLIAEVAPGSAPLVCDRVAVELWNCSSWSRR